VIEDVRQETFVRVLQKARMENGVQSPERLGAFVNSVCNNVIMEFFRANSRHPQIPEDAPDVVDHSADPAQSIAAKERQKLVAGVLAELSPKDRTLLMQVFFEERDKDDICRDMDVNQEYLRVLIHRAKGRFRSILTRSSAELH
jgi:RNA polymerase sigma-70 factor (ECF subfamily)